MTPASLANVLKKSLRRELGILGIIISDDSGNLVAGVFSEDFREKVKGKENALATSATAALGAIEIAGTDFKLGDAEEGLLIFAEGRLLLRSINIDGKRKYILVIISSKDGKLGLLRVIADELTEVIIEHVGKGHS